MDQNRMIEKQKVDLATTRSNIVQLYTALVKYKVEFNTEQTAVESEVYPDLKGEDLANLRSEELISSLARAFKTMTISLKENRAEIRDIMKEFDSGIEEELEKWNRLRAEEGRAKAAETFRAHNVAANTKIRPETPEPPLVPTAGASIPTNAPPTPPESADHFKGGKKSAGQPKSPTTTFDKVKNKLDPSKTPPITRK